MATQTESDKALILYELDADLNSVIFCSLLHGIYTGIVAVTLGNMIFSDKSRPTGRTLTVVIILLYIATTIDFALTLSYVPTVFVDHGQTMWTKYMSYQTPGMGITIGAASAGAICTILADSTMVWRCWIVWGQRWEIVLLPVLLLVSDIVLKIIAMSRHYTPPDGYVLGYVLYSSFTLASTLWCTLSIIYRIVTVARAGEAGGGLNAYRHVIEVLVESSALYSISLILFVAFYARNDATMYYFDVLSAITRGIAPTLVVGRVAAGQARPDDSWQGSIVSSLHFGTHPGSENSQQDSMTTWNEDLEGQRETDGELDYRTLVNPQDYTTNEGLILGDVIDERPEDHTSAILIVPRA